MVLIAFTGPRRTRTLWHSVAMPGHGPGLVTRRDITAVLPRQQSERRVSTGLGALDAVLGGLYWGDNVVWELHGASPGAFYRAIAGISAAFDTRAFVAIEDDGEEYRSAGITIIDAGSGSEFAGPGELIREIRRLCQPRGRRLLLFDSLDAMVRAWGAANTRRFFARCCPLLLEMEAIAYWSTSMRETPSMVRDTVEAVTQCVLRVDERSVRVVKAEGRNDAVRGSVLHWRDEGGRLALAPAEVIGQVAASLRAIRRSRGLSQHDLAALGGVTASAISQAERAARGLSLATLVRLSSALGVTIDDLLRGVDPVTYRIGRRADDPQRGSEPTITLIEGGQSDLRVDLVRLDARTSGVRIERTATAGTGIVAVASGLVAVQVAGQTATLRSGEVLVAASYRVDGWRNLGQTEAVLFWIIVPAVHREHASTWG